MGVTIGIFESEQRVLDAVELLRANGAHKDGVRVIVKSEENVPLLTASEAIQVESITGIQEARDRSYGDRDGDGSSWGDDGVLPLPAAGLLATPGVSGTGGYAGGVVPAGLAAAGLAGRGGSLLDLDGDGLHTDDVLADLGLPDGDAGRLADEVNGGRYLVVVDDRPDDQAGSLLSQAGAVEVLN
ncbi:general stress protein [Cohnella sp. GbtcB17]|uniref:general stress protein n=1 Tax=Cohnella sp. GbtcB17 TaxID=2824762 RepID=UPI001C2F4DE5|nr:general stress protein [Cohnella sp. GbtcB17]